MEKSTRKFQNRDNIMDELVFEYEIEKLWKESLDEPVSLSGWFKVFPEAKPYLEARKGNLIKRAIETANDIERDLVKARQRGSGVWFWKEVIRVFKVEPLKEMRRRIREIDWALIPPRTKRGDESISSEMIQKAKQFPFQNLLKVNRAGFALCPFHSEKTPSFCVKNNFYYCFSCGVGGDTIQFLMERDNISFIQAVERLQ